MNPVELMTLEAETVQAETPEGAEIVRPYSTRAWDELARMHLVPPLEVWGGFTLGASCVIFGVGGLGKSRVALNIARNQALGLPFAGLPTAPRPLRHLMMGSENSIHRLQYDIRKMNVGLTAEQIATLGAHVRLATLEGPEDTYIALTPANVERWRLTLEEHRPEVLWCDPWGDILDGDGNSDDDARATISTLRRLLRKVSPEAGLCILAHSRTGATNILQAVGYDSANFGKGSKALYSAARCVWNLAPGSESEDPPLVCAHAKCNDKPKEKPFAIRLDPETMTYNREDGFDLEAWQAELSARARGKRGPKKGPAMTEEQAVEALGDKVGTTAEVIQILRDKGANKDDAADLLKRLVLAGTWEQWRPPTKNAPTYNGPPDALKRKRTEVADKLQKKLSVG
jgi:hypothetical protein